MNNVNKTLYIPLYGKAFVSKKNIVRILIGIAVVVIFAIVYFIANFEIVF